MVMASAPPYSVDSAVVEGNLMRPNQAEMPPTYEDSANPNTMPPTYESLYGEFRQVDNPKGLAQFLAKAFAIVISTMTAAVILALLNIIPLGMIVLGSVNMHNCPVEPCIPIWLVVTGSFSLLKSGTNFYYRARRQHEGRPPSAADVNPNPFDGLLSCFLLIWFIIGSVWIYSAYDEVQWLRPQSDDYCEQFTYEFSYLSVTIGYVVLALTLFCFCCCCCCICCRTKRLHVSSGGDHVNPV